MWKRRMRARGGQADRRTGGQWSVSWREFLVRIRQVAGMPDYEAYVTHLREHHPGTIPASEREFFDGFVQARSGSVSRCC